MEGRFPNREFDIQFWQEQGDDAIFEAAWELVELSEEVKHGRKPIFQRTVGTLFSHGSTRIDTDKKTHLLSDSTVRSQDV